MSCTVILSFCISGELLPVSGRGRLLPATSHTDCRRPALCGIHALCVIRIQGKLDQWQHIDNTIDLLKVILSWAKSSIWKRCVEMNEMINFHLH